MLFNVIIAITLIILFLYMFKTLFLKENCIADV